MQNKYTPFVDEVENEENNQQESLVNADQEQYAGYTPFTNLYETESSPEGEWESDPFANEYYDSLQELYDTEFESAIDNVVAELQDHLMSYESAGSFLNESHTEQLAINYLQPLADQVQETFEAIANELESMPLDQMNELELETVIDEVYMNRKSNCTPAQEFFLKKLVNKVKTVAKKVMKVGNKFSPLHIALKKLGPVVQPLIMRILDKALDRLPASVRDAAKELAAKLFKGKKAGKNGSKNTDQTSEDNAQGTEDSPTGEPVAGDEGEAPTVYPSMNIQAEFDHYLSQFIQSENESDQNNLQAEYENAVETERNDEMHEVEEAREKFIQELEKLEEGEDPTPALENFLPVMIKAAMKALKIGIKIIGRDKVVKFLAGLIAKWISKFISPEKAKSLSLVMADKGMKLLKLEASDHEGNPRAVYEAIANTVQEVVQKLSTLDEEVVNTSDILAHEAYQAFENAAAAYFPDNAIRFEARESETGNGYWERKNKYNKYTKVFTVELIPSQLKSIETFGGTNLLSFVKDTLGLNTEKPIKAQVHIFQAIKGTTLSQLTLQEKSIPGLGNASRKAYNQIHPLTVQAASTLLGQPGLGKNVRSISNRNRNLIFDGERFFYLQIQGASVQPATTLDSSQVTHVTASPTANGGTVDIRPVQKGTQLQVFVSGSLRRGLIIKNCIYISEKDCQIILAGLKKESFGELYEYIKKLNPGLEKNFFGDQHKTGNIILKGLMETAAKVIKENLPKMVVDKIKQRIQEFEAAVRDPRHGVTLTVQFTFSFSKGQRLKLRLQEAMQNAEFLITPGYVQKPLRVRTGVNQQVMLTPRNPRANGRTFFAAITPINGAVIGVKKPSFN